MFYFRDVDKIKGDEIDLVVTARKPSDAEKGYVPSYQFSMVKSGTDIEVGRCDLRIGHNRNTFYGGNIGYGVHEEYRGNHFAAKACLMMRQLAREHGMEYLIITNSPDNIPSRKTCDYIGAEFIEIVELPPDNELYKEGYREKCRYRWNI
ncbi:MAG TPA: GNAT family N-acetyltransferase [Clostridia bacterium]|nr:GNAT family N-acetyltransferase [Clostridia bacterium]HPQ47253.1 GNAT family N-acetyltransferase [Clostridia bacterium]HRX42209.1 GNAT family N-acetyltransferase [Clostridia bacterium]